MSFSYKIIFRSANHIAANTKQGLCGSLCGQSPGLVTTVDLCWLYSIYCDVTHIDLTRVGPESKATRFASLPFHAPRSWYYFTPGFSRLGNTVWRRYNTVNFLPNPLMICPIARPLGWDMWCNLWYDTMFYILLQSTQCCMKYIFILERVIAALDCICQFVGAIRGRR